LRKPSFETAFGITEVKQETVNQLMLELNQDDTLTSEYKNDVNNHSEKYPLVRLLSKKLEKKLSLSN
jgi:hypothetical protein